MKKLMQILIKYISKFNVNLNVLFKKIIKYLTSFQMLNNCLIKDEGKIDTDFIHIKSYILNRGYLKIKRTIILIYYRKRIYFNNQIINDTY